MTYKELLAEMKQGRRPKGLQINGRTIWAFEGNGCTSAVKTLEARGLARISYYASGAVGFDLTGEGLVSND